MEASPLRRLPAELRNRIYELALYERKGITLFAGNEVETLHATAAVPLALTVTCQEIRRETLSMFYAINKFGVVTNFFMYHRLHDTDRYTKARFAQIVKWLEYIGAANTKHLTHLCVKLGTDNLRYVSTVSRDEESLSDSWQTLLHHLHGLKDLPSACLHVSFDVLYTRRNERTMHLPQLSIGDKALTRHRVNQVYEEEIAWLQEKDHRTRIEALIAPRNAPFYGPFMGQFALNTQNAGLMPFGSAKEDLDKWHECLCAVVLGDGSG
ncbi:hypothetical protein LTR85_004333 [Meristemomyces frigidus]|nr:hypothetical protein LTR85_004333 [Meristemomyces frigidus]